MVAFIRLQVYPKHGCSERIDRSISNKAIVEINCFKKSNRNLGLTWENNRYVLHQALGVILALLFVLIMKYLFRIYLILQLRQKLHIKICTKNLVFGGALSSFRSSLLLNGPFSNSMGPPIITTDSLLITFRSYSGAILFIPYVELGLRGQQAPLCWNLLLLTYIGWSSCWSCPS